MSPDEAVKVLREALTMLCDAVDFPGAAVAQGEVPKDWHPCRDVHGEATAALAVLEARIEELGSALREIANELGVPDENYPTPVANAVRIARTALKEDG